MDDMFEEVASIWEGFWPTSTGLVTNSGSVGEYFSLLFPWKVRLLSRNVVEFCLMSDCERPFILNWSKSSVSSSGISTIRFAELLVVEMWRLVAALGL